MTLTINIDERKLNALRKKAASEGSSVERLFEKYLDSFLDEENVRVSDQIDTSFGTSESRDKSPLEIISELQKKAGIGFTEDFDEKQDYREHILRKYA